MANQGLWDTPSARWDVGNWDSTLAPGPDSKRMNAKVALNLTNIDNRWKLAKFQTSITKCTGNAAIGTATPPIADCQSAHDAAETVLDTVDAKEAELKNLRVQRDQLMATVMN